MTAVFSFTVLNPPTAKVVVDRHAKNCKYPDRILDDGTEVKGTLNRRHCDCPKYLYVTPGRHTISAHTNNWEEAEKRAIDFVREHDPRIGKLTKLEIVPMEVIPAFDHFIKDKENSGLRKSTVTKIRTIRDAMEKWLKEWNAECDATQRITYIHELVLEPLMDFFYSMNDGLSGTTKSKRRGYLRQLYDHALAHNWKENTGETVPQGRHQIPKSNPANFLKATGKKARATHKRPLTDELYFALLAACDLYEASLKTVNKAAIKGIGQRAKLFWQTMYNVGFAITDTMIAQASRLVKRRDGTYAFDVNRKKTDAEVYLKVDTNFALELLAMPRQHPDFLFWNGEGEPDNAADTMAKLWPKLLKLIKPEILERSCGKDEDGNLVMPTPHCLRYNFAENLFLEGATIAEVARLLGDTQAVVEKHYWKMSTKVQSRFDSLMDSMHKRRTHMEIPASDLLNEPGKPASKKDLQELKKIYGEGANA